MNEPVAGPGGASSWQVLRGALVAFAVFCTFGSGELVDSATGLDVGPARTIALPLARGLDRVTNFLSLNRPADFVATRVLGRDESDVDFVFPSSTVAPVVTTTTAPPRLVTEVAPLRVGVFGDSMAADFGARMKLDLGESPLFDISVDGRPSTGLARLDFFHWPQQLSDEFSGDVEVAVVFFGGNDDQALTDSAGDVVAATPGSAEWLSEYSRRVGGVMDLAVESGIRLVWVAMPLVEPAPLAATAASINEILAAQAADRPAVTVVEIERLLDPAGVYQTFREIDGETARCRRSDGIHLTLDCVGLVSDEIARVVSEMFRVGQIPERSGPGVTVPGVTVPGVTVPGSTVPGETVPTDPTSPAEPNSTTTVATPAPSN